MSYLSSPLWLVFLLLTFASRLTFAGPDTATEIATGDYHRAAWLFVATMAMLLLPKLWGYLLLLRNRPLLAACGGASRVAVSILLESLISALIAPIMMAFHTTFVVATFLGRSVHWNCQERSEQGLPLRAAAAAHWRHTLSGAAAGLVTWNLAPVTFLWMMPVVAGLLLAIPLSMLLGSVRLGQAAARRRLLITPEESNVPTVLERQRHLLALRPTESTKPLALFHRVLADPAFCAQHCSILKATDAVRDVDLERLGKARRQLLAGGPGRVSSKNRKAVLSDPLAIKSLHLMTWTADKHRRQFPVGRTLNWAHR